MAARFCEPPRFHYTMKNIQWMPLISCCHYILLAGYVIQNLWKRIQWLQYIYSYLDVWFGVYIFPRIHDATNLLFHTIPFRYFRVCINKIWKVWVHIPTSVCVCVCVRMNVPGTNGREFNEHIVNARFYCFFPFSGFKCVRVHDGRPFQVQTRRAYDAMSWIRFRRSSNRPILLANALLATAIYIFFPFHNYYQITQISKLFSLPYLHCGNFTPCGHCI